MILSLLKAHTRPAHDRVESLMPVMQPGLTREQYRALLVRLRSLYGPLEEHLARLGVPDAFAFPARCKTPLLERDLAFLGPQPDPAARMPLPRLERVAHAAGCLYVLEGATLGGQVIARRLRDHLQLDAAHGAAFFNPYGDQVGPMWRSFGRALEDYVQETGEERGVLEGAERTFQAFEACLGDLSPGAHGKPQAARA